MRNNVLGVVLNILNNGASPQELNHTHITLIPKKKCPENPKDFRPISLCNVIIKIVTKTIANRLKHVLPNLISDTQSAFVPGRLISDNSLLAFELFHAMKNNSSKKARSFALKLDMSKAYDRVEWSFLKSIFLRTGLSPAFVGLIMRCVSSVSYAVLVNGCPSSTFSSSRVSSTRGPFIALFISFLCIRFLSVA